MVLAAGACNDSFNSGDFAFSLVANAPGYWLSHLHDIVEHASRLVLDHVHAPQLLLGDLLAHEHGFEGVLDILGSHSFSKSFCSHRGDLRAAAHGRNLMHSLRRHSLRGIEGLGELCSERVQDFSRSDSFSLHTLPRLSGTTHGSLHVFVCERTIVWVSFRF